MVLLDRLGELTVNRIVVAYTATNINFASDVDLKRHHCCSASRHSSNLEHFDFEVHAVVGGYLIGETLAFDWMYRWLSFDCLDCYLLLNKLINDFICQEMHFYLISKIYSDFYVSTFDYCFKNLINISKTLAQLKSRILYSSNYINTAMCMTFIVLRLKLF